MPQDEHKLLKGLKDYWSILLFVGSLIFLAARYEARLDTAESRLTLLESQSTEHTTLINEIRVELAEIRTTLNLIKEATVK